MKKMTFLFLLLLCGILFGCKLPEVETKENPLESVLSERITVDYDSPEQLIEQMFSAIQKGDVDAFRALFAVDVQNADPELDEQIREAFADIKVLLCRYTEQMAKGEIHDIYFDNIQVLNGDIPVSTIRGFQTPTEEVRVHDIHFDNITFMGERCETWQDMRLVTELANDIYVNGVRTCKQMKF